MQRLAQGRARQTGQAALRLALLGCLGASCVSAPQASPQGPSAHDLSAQDSRAQDSRAHEQDASSTQGAAALARLSAPAPGWTRWRPQPTAPSSPSLTGLRAFDYWQIEDAGFVQQLWPALFAALDYLRAQLGPAQADMRQTIELLLTMMEPGRPLKGRSSPQVDVTFVTGQDESGEWEGALWRVFVTLEGGAAPGLTLLLKRRVGRDAAPSRVTLWGSSGHEQGKPFSASLVREAAKTASLRWDEGLVAQPQERPQERSQAAGLMLEVLLGALWPRISQQAYLEPAIGRAAQQRALPASFPPACGLSLRERELEQIYADTVFIPTDALEGFEGPGRLRPGS